MQRGGAIESIGLMGLAANASQIAGGLLVFGDPLSTDRACDLGAGGLIVLSFSGCGIDESAQPAAKPTIAIEGLYPDFDRARAAMSHTVVATPARSAPWQRAVRRSRWASDRRALAPSGSPPACAPAKAAVVSAEIEEIDPDGRVLWRWRSRDHIGLGETGRW